MVRRITTGRDVLHEALSRITALYDQGYRVVVSMSMGKGASVCLALALRAAQTLGSLPVDVVYRDDEICFPPTPATRLKWAERDDIVLHTYVAGQPLLNPYSRALPFFWPFDQTLDPEHWARLPSPTAIRLDGVEHTRIVHPSRFPPSSAGLVNVLGLRVQQRRTRGYGVFTTHGYLSDPDQDGVRLARPIFDWTDGDVWRFLAETHTPYDRTYDTLAALGIARSRLQIGTPPLSTVSLRVLDAARRSWPRWWRRITARLDGVADAATFGRVCLEPHHEPHETWAQTYVRECISDAPAWIAVRSELAMENALEQHHEHTFTPFPDSHPCPRCPRPIGSWQELTLAMYGGDPASHKCRSLPPVDPATFNNERAHARGAP